MKNSLLFTLLCGLFINGSFSHIAQAKPCGNGHIADNKTCHVGNTSPTTSTAASPINSNDLITRHKSRSKKSALPAASYGQSAQPSNVSSGAYGRQASVGAAKHSGTLVQKSGLRTCPVTACQVVANYAKGKKIFWTVENNGFVNLYDSAYWVKISDIKRQY